MNLFSNLLVFAAFAVPFAPIGYHPVPFEQTGETVPLKIVSVQYGQEVTEPQVMLSVRNDGAQAVTQTAILVELVGAHNEVLSTIIVLGYAGAEKREGGDYLRWVMPLIGGDSIQSARWKVLAPGESASLVQVGHEILRNPPDRARVRVLALRLDDGIRRLRSIGTVSRRATPDELYLTNPEYRRLKNPAARKMSLSPAKSQSRAGSWSGRSKQNWAPMPNGP